MKTWNYLNPQNDPTLQNDWNQTIITMFNQIVKENNIEKPIKISASYKFKLLFESLIFINNNYIINYRFDNSDSVFINDVKLIIENFTYSHQENEEWIESQKNVFLNLDFSDSKILYSSKYMSKNKLKEELNYTFSSGRNIVENDIIYSGILIDSINSRNTLIHFHIDELKSNNPIYRYSEINDNFDTLLPCLELINNETINKQ